MYFVIYTYISIDDVSKLSYAKWIILCLIIGLGHIPVDLMSNNFFFYGSAVIFAILLSNLFLTVLVTGILYTGD